MDQPALWLVALNAFAAVIVLLAVLAGAIRLLAVVFPVRSAPLAVGAGAGPEVVLDAATLAAIQVAVERARPGGRVVRVEESSGGAS